MKYEVDLLLWKSAELSQITKELLTMNLSNVLIDCRICHLKKDTVYSLNLSGQDTIQTLKEKLNSDQRWNPSSMRIVFRSRFVGDEVTLESLLMQSLSLRRDSIKRHQPFHPPCLLFSLIATSTEIKFTIISSPHSYHRYQVFTFFSSDTIGTFLEFIRENIFGKDYSEKLKIIWVPPIVDGRHVCPPIQLQRLPVDLRFDQIPQICEENKVGFVYDCSGLR
jgi:hypothetical protein